MRLKPLNFFFGMTMLLLALSARADLSFVVAPSSQSGNGSSKVFFTGTLTNSSATDNLLLNNIQFAFDGAATNYLTADTNAFFGNVPGVLLPGEVYTDVVFGVAINPATPAGTYTGTVTVQGGPDIFAASNLMSQTFQIMLSSPTLAILAVGVTSNSGAGFVVSWSSPPAGLVLQENTDTSTTNWQTVTNDVTVTNGLNQVFFTPSSSQQFFRLATP